MNLYILVHYLCSSQDIGNTCWVNISFDLSISGFTLYNSYVGEYLLCQQCLNLYILGHYLCSSHDVSKHLMCQHLFWFVYFRVYFIQFICWWIYIVSAMFQAIHLGVSLCSSWEFGKHLLCWHCFDMYTSGYTAHMLLNIYCVSTVSIYAS